MRRLKFVGPQLLKLDSVGRAQPWDFEPAFRAMTTARRRSLWFSAHHEYASKAHCGTREGKIDCSVCGESGRLDGCGLMSYGLTYTDRFRRAATYVGMILKGAKRGNLSVEQPTKFEFVINIKAAKRIAQAIPPTVLVQADIASCRYAA